MTDKEILQSDILDILFENRNKYYGAYSLRRQYNHRLLIAVCISLCGVLAFYLMSLLFAHERQPGFRVTDAPDVIVSTVDIKPAVLPPEAAHPVAMKQIKDAGIRIVPDKVADDPVPEKLEIEHAAISNVTKEGEIPLDINKGITDKAGNGPEVKHQEETGPEFYPVEVQPSFPGGPEALALFFANNLAAPVDLEPNEKRIILVRFEVGADGIVSRTEVVRSGGDNYDREVLRAFKKMPKWNPAIQNGHKIAVSFTQPVTFVGQEQ